MTKQLSPAAFLQALLLIPIAIFPTELLGGTVITNNLPANVAIINIDARADGSGRWNGDQSLWYSPFNTAGTLLEFTIQPGTYSFRVIDPEDAQALFPGLTTAQTNQIYTGWTFNSPWTTDYLVFDSAAATNGSLPQLFDGAFSNTNGGPNTWQFYPNAPAAYHGAVSNGFANLLRTAATGGRDSTNDFTSYTFASSTALVFAIPDSGLFDNAGGVSVWISPAVESGATELNIERAATGSVRLLWATNNVALSLQFNTNLANSSWSAALPFPVVVGTNNVVTNATSDDHRFYRLFKP